MTTITETINAQVKSIVDDVKALPETLKKVDVAELQKQAQGFAQTAVGTATSAYADLAKKGEELVARAKGIRIEDLKKTVDNGVEDVTKQAKGFADDAQKRAEQFVTEAKTQVTKATSKAPTTTRTTAEQVDTTVKKTPEPAKKAPAKKAPAARKAPTAKKAPVKKAPAKKSPTL
jgi:heparin binding hemagglutinin HbhA